jgi:hypothetical protein
MANLDDAKKTIRVTSAEACKLIKMLEEEKEAALEEEMEQCTYKLLEGEEELPLTYDYETTRAFVDERDRKIKKLRHAIHKFNMETVLCGYGITIDEALVQLAQMSRKLKVLERMKRIPVVTKNRATLRDLSAASGLLGNRRADSSLTCLFEYEYANFDVATCKSDYAQLYEKVSALQLAIDLYNQTKAFEVEL